MDMQPHQERVVAERNELSERIEKLAAFFETDLFSSLPTAEARRLCRQYGHMKSYLDILDERIEAFSAPLTAPEP
jgi:hypothetical protein